MNNKNIELSLLLIFSVLIVSFLPVLAQKQSTREIIQSAMRDELARNITKLKLENLQEPFYIAYTIRDANSLEIRATLGAIVSSNENHYRNHYVRLMVGDYNLNDENYFDFTSGGYRQTLLQGADQLPLEDDYHGIRRALWIATDNLYKSATEQYERKKAAIEQQTRSEEDKALADYSKTPVVKHALPPLKFDMERARWENNARELSGIFREYPDIYSSQLRIFLYQSDVYFTNSEGTETVKPLTLAAVQIIASTQAEDGEPLSDQIFYYRTLPQDLPSMETVKQEIHKTAKNLVALRTAPVFEDSYTGPLMFADEGVAEFFAQRLFTGASGLLSARKPIVSDPRAAAYLSQTQGEPLEDKIGTRILSRDLTIKSVPNLNTFANQKLIGSYDVDEEGVKPASEVILVENGVLKTMLSNRIPTKSVKESNGHQRPVVGIGSIASNSLGPGVISVTVSNGLSQVDMKKELLQLARDEGLEYAILVRKVKSPVSGAVERFDPLSFITMSRGRQQGPSLTEPILVYRVYVNDGREELVRSVKLGSLALSSLRRMASAAQNQLVYNTLVVTSLGPLGPYSFAPSTSSFGIPASFIVPQSIILEELEVENEKRDYTPKLPVVPSPLVEK